MHGATIVPHHDVALVPFLHEDMLRVGRVVPELCEERVTFVSAHPNDPGTLRSAAEVKCLPTGFSVCSHKRMDNAAPFAEVLALRCRLSESQLSGLVIDVLKKDLPAIN